MNWNRNQWLIISLAGITLVNLIQAFVLELYADEAYYVMYSRFPDWGYFDHPPMVAILIYFGQLFFDGEFGTRLFFILLTTASYYLLYQWINPNNYKLFWLVVLALFPLHLLGFMALPDIPVFFFAILFFWAFQHFQQNQSLKHTIILALCIAGLLYSKYHGVLIVVFTFFANPKFFLRKSFYLLVVISVLLYLPHFIWLFQHEFSSIKYHFLERSSSVYRLNYSLDYLAAFIFYNGPLVFMLMLWQILSRASGNSFDRTLKFNVIALFFFFLISSFKGRTEANWTLLTIVPVIYLIFNAEIKFIKAYQILAVSSIILIIIFRIHLIYPLVELKRDRANEFHGHKEFVSQIIQASNDKPLVANRYQEASLLSNYSNKLIPSININSRKNQFDFWDWLDAYENKDVMMLKRGDAPEGVKSFSHPYYGNYYLEEIKQLPLIRYPEILISKPSSINGTYNFTYIVKSQNQINTERVIYAQISIYNDLVKKDTLVLVKHKAINQQEEIKQSLEWPYDLPPKYLEISILSDSLGIWKSKNIKLD